MRNQFGYLVWERVVLLSEGLHPRAVVQYEWYVAYAKAETDTNRKIRLSSSQGKRYVVSCIQQPKRLLSNRGSSSQ